ncbi:IQ domain-containing protein IQM1 [Lathyrus oleraceus]|uniref:IQ domain-containing protein IQM1 n=1 Tax=Pisum sativum TaxID=3888 RepID=UPI001FC58894|nr:IQ domain-containing protein IQM1-like [Pisum sativum]
MDSSKTNLPVLSLPKADSELDAAAIKIQKVYKSYQTRKNLADCAIIVEELWWRAFYSTALERNTVSFVDGEESVSELDAAATKIQKVYKGYRTRRKLEECAVLVEESWQKLLDFAALKRSSASFFDVHSETYVQKPET